MSLTEVPHITPAAHFSLFVATQKLRLQGHAETCPFLTVVRQSITSIQRSLQQGCHVKLPIFTAYAHHVILQDAAAQCHDTSGRSALPNATAEHERAAASSEQQAAWNSEQ